MVREAPTQLIVPIAVRNIVGQRSADPSVWAQPGQILRPSGEGFAKPRVSIRVVNPFKACRDVTRLSDKSGHTSTERPTVNYDGLES
jgi:hypothetical protein